MASERRSKRLKHERRVLWLALVTGAPGLALALALLWVGDFAPRTQWTLTILVVVAWLAIAATLREQVIRPLQTISNMLAAGSSTGPVRRCWGGRASSCWVAARGSWGSARASRRTHPESSIWSSLARGDGGRYGAARSVRKGFPTSCWCWRT